MTFILPALLNFIRAAERWIYSSTPTPKTHVLYQELHPYAKTRKQAFQALLRGCCVMYLRIILIWQNRFNRVQSVHEELDQ